MLAKMLREQKLGAREKNGKLIPVRVMAPKVDGPSWEPPAYELAGLGFGDLAADNGFDLFAVDLIAQVLNDDASFNEDLAFVQEYVHRVGLVRERQLPSR